MKKFLSIICCACFLYAGYSAVFADEPVYKEYTVTVAEGETLWEIAGRHTEAREDVRVLKVPLRVHDNGLMVAER